MEKVFNLVKKTIVIFLVFFVSQTNTKTVQMDSITYKEADPSQWTAVDGLGRTVHTYGDGMVNKTLDKRKYVGMFYWDWHEQIGYIVQNGKNLNPRANNLNDIISKYPEAKNNYDHPIWKTYHSGYWWNEPIYGFYKESDEYVLRRQAELLADAGVDFIVIDATNSFNITASGTKYEEVFKAWSHAKQDGINVPKIVFMLGFVNPGTSDDARNAMSAALTKLYTDFYSQNKFSDLWFKMEGDNKPLIIADYRTANGNQNILKYFTFRTPVSSYFYKDKQQFNNEIKWGWLSTFPQAYYADLDGNIEMTTVGVAQNANYKNNELTAMNGKNVMGRSYVSGEYAYSYKYRNKNIIVNDKISNSSLYGRNFQQQWDYALNTVKPHYLFVTGWNEWIVGRYRTWPESGNSIVNNAFPDQFDDEHSRDIEPTKGKLKDHYYYQLVTNIRKYKGANEAKEQKTKKTININEGKAQWNDSNIIKYDHYTYSNENISRSIMEWGANPKEQYINDTALEGNDLKTAKVSYDGANIYFYIETNEAFKEYKNKTRLLIDTIEHITNTSTKNWEEFEYILNREGATDTTLRLERSKGGWNWEKVADVEYTVDNNVMQVSIPRKYLELTSSNIKFNFKWTDNNLKNGDIMTLYTDGDAAPGGRFAFRFEGSAPINSVNIKYHVNGGSLSKTHGSNIGKTGNYITVDNSDIVKKLYYKEKTTSDGLPNYNNKEAINIERKGYKTLSGQEFIDADGKTYGQAKVYSSEDFCDILQESCTKELKVNWTPIEYQIVYKINGATFGSSHPTTGKYNSVINIDNPTKKGYTFTGWTASNINNSTSRIGSTKTAVSDNWDGANPTKNKYFKNLSATDKAEITMTANFTPITYKITYNLNGGTNPNNKASYTVETANFTLTNPTKKGYTFTGWTEEGEEEKVKTVTIVKGTTGNKTFTANWTPTNYKITYNLNDGEDPKNPEKYTVETNTFTLKNPEKDGYTFTGWTGSGLSSESKEVSIAKGTIGNKEYTANWNINKLIIRFLMNGGELSEKHGSTISTSGDYITLNNSKNIQTVEYNSSLPSAGLSNYNNSAAINIEKKGYKAVSKKEWIDTKGNTFDQAVQYKQSDFCDVTKSNCTIDLKVNWTPVTYKITYNLNGGTNPNNPKNYTVETETFNINNPVKEGFTFSGWKDEKGNVNANVKITKGTVGNKTLEALWEPNKYQITYNTNGGTTLPVQTVNYQAQIEEPEAPTKAGYTFTGWYEDQALTELYTFNEMPNKNITLYAGWKANTYTITYKMNGGTNNKSNPSSYQTGAEKTLLNPTKTGYIFKGWYTDSAFKNKIEKITSNMNKNITVYASWEAIEYQITFNSNGGSAVSPIKGIYKTKIEEPEAPTKTGYTFTGWYEDQTLTELYTFNEMPNKNITLYAGWTSNANVITYKMNGGTNNKSNPSSYQTGEEKTLLTPTKTGYTFTGWYTDSTLKNKIEKITSSMNKNITLYAGWAINKYQITFDSNGGSTVNPITQEYNTKIEKPTSPTKEGYLFIDWYTDEQLTKTYTFSKMPNKNITLYAGWEEKINIVSFNTYGGSELSQISVKDGEKLVEPKAPEKEGYTFAGWYTDESFSTTYNFDTAVKNDLNLYAKWNIKKYTITYNTNGGNNIEKAEVEYGSKIENLPTPSKTGYTFQKWTLNKTTQAPPETMPAKNITLKANWKKNEYTITFNTNGGSEINPIKEKYNEEIEEIDIPTKTGYKFAGWYKDKELTEVYTPTQMPAENITLYAKWTENENIIYYVTNGGELDKSSPTTFTTGRKTELKAPQKDGYEFEGWYTSEQYNEKVTSINTNNDEDIVLYAKWADNEYTITFNTNGGSTISQIKGNYGDEIEQPINPTKKGYNFIGWYTDPELTEEYEFDTIPSENITLYAGWVEEDKNIIRFNTNGGSNVNIIEAHALDKIEKPNDPVKEGFKFAGWFKDEQLTEIFDFTVMPTEDITLYAKWITNDVNKIEYILNGGSNDTNNPVEYEIGKEIILNNPSKEGYVFGGWYTDENYSNKIEKITKNMQGDIKLYAKWYSSGLIVNVPQTLANIKTIIIIIGSLLLTVSILTIAYINYGKKDKK